MPESRVPDGEELGTSVLEAARAHRSVILAGSNTNDIFPHDGRWMYLPELISLCHASEGRVMVYYSPMGMEQRPAPGHGMLPLRLPAPDTPPGQAMRELRHALISVRDPAVVVVDYADLLLPEATAAAPPAPDQQVLIEALASFPVDSQLEHHRLVLIARADSLDTRLPRFPGWEVVRADLPTEALRTQMARRIQERGSEAPDGPPPLEDGTSPQELGRLSGGLTNDDLMRGYLSAQEAGKPLTRRWVQETKAARIRQRNVEGLTVYSPGHGLADVAGLPQVRLFLQERKGADIYPRSIVLAGPPGTGKTLVVAAIADELGWPAVALGNVRSMWVGETERIMRGVLATVRSMAPIVVHIDEVDQVLGQRQTGPTGDSGIGARILAELWTFLGSSAHPDLPVLFVLTTNRPDLLDQATRSRSEIIPVLHPTGQEVLDLLGIALTQAGWEVPEETIREAMHGAEEALGVASGRMLVRIADRASLNAHLAGADELGTEDLTKAVRSLLERIDEVDDERMALKSLEMATFESYLPWVAAQILGEQPEILPYVRPLLRDGWRLDREQMLARIAELDEAARVRMASRIA